MSKFGQYCPVAQALELIGDRWTLLIIRDMLDGTRHFTAMLRGLPGLSRGLLSRRLVQLTDAGIVTKRRRHSGKSTTEYELTAAGVALSGVIEELMIWGADWAFGDPSEDQLDPLLLLWWMHNRVATDNLPGQRVSIQFEFTGTTSETYWLVLTKTDASICLTDPGYELNLIVQADVAAFFKVWLGRLELNRALHEDLIRIEGLPRFTRAFPTWFLWSPASAAVRRAAVPS